MHLINSDSQHNNSEQKFADIANQIKELTLLSVTYLFLSFKWHMFLLFDVYIFIIRNSCELKRTFQQLELLVVFLSEINKPTKQKVLKKVGN